MVGGQTLSQYDSNSGSEVDGFSSFPSACATACSDFDLSFEKIDQIFDNIIAEMSAAATTTNPTATAATNYLAASDYQTHQIGSFDITDNNNNNNNSSFEIDPNVLDLILADSLLNMEA